VEDLAVRDAAGHEAIIEAAQFRRVEARMNRRTCMRSSETLATEARAGFEAHGCVGPAMLDHLPLRCSWGTYKTRFPRGIDEALEQAFAGEIADRTTGIVELIQGAMDVTQGEGAWIADATLRVHIQAVFPHSRKTGVHWRVRRPSIPCDVVICFCIDASHTDQNNLLLVRSDQLAHRRQGLYLRCDGGRRATRFSVAPEALAARVAYLRYTSGEASEVRLLQEARTHPLVSFAALARALDWPYHAVCKMYWRLRARGEWFPPLNYRAGRRVEIVCAQCGRSRLERPNPALKLRSELCLICTRARPKHRIKILCPRCGREAERWPSVVKKLSSGAQTVCRKCRVRAGLRQASAPSASTDRTSP
jgi:hypothetical protein